MTGWPVSDPAVSVSSRASASTDRLEARSSRASAQAALAALSRRPRGTRASKGLDGIRPAVVLAALHGCEEGQGAEVPADAALLPRLPGQAQPFRRAGRGGGVAAGGHLGDGEGLEEIREQDELAGGAGSGDRPCIEVVSGRVVAEVASRRAGEAQPAGIIERLCQHHGLAKQRRARAVSPSRMLDSHEQAQRELVDAPSPRGRAAARRAASIVSATSPA